MGGVDRQNRHPTPGEVGGGFAVHPGFDPARADPGLKPIVGTPCCDAGGGLSRVGEEHDRQVWPVGMAVQGFDERQRHAIHLLQHVRRGHVPIAEHDLALLYTGTDLRRQLVVAVGCDQARERVALVQVGLVPGQLAQLAVSRLRGDVDPVPPVSKVGAKQAGGRGTPACPRTWKRREDPRGVD